MVALDEDILKCMMNQNFTSVKTFVQLMFTDIKNEMKDLRQENVELKRSLEFSQNDVLELKSEVAQLKNLNKNNYSQSSFDSVVERIRILGDGSRRKNIRITGLAELSHENSEQTQHKVQKLISENLQLKNVNITSAFRVGKQPSQNPRPIVAQLSSVNCKVACFKSSNRLKGSNIYISEDVCKATQDIRRQKLHLLKQKRDEGYIAYFSGTEIIAKTKRHNQRNMNASTSAQNSLNPAPSTSELNPSASVSDSSMNKRDGMQLRNRPSANNR